MNNPILIPMTVSSDQVTYEMSVGDSQQTFSMSCETAIEYIRGRLQEKEATPSEQIQSITPDEDYDALSKVTVDAIPSDYVGSDVPRQTTLSASGNTVTASAGYYENSVSQSVQSGIATVTGSITADPFISVDSNGLITATVSASEPLTPTVTEGYITQGTSGSVSVNGSGTKQLPTRTSSDMSVNGATVTAPSGWYANNASKSVASGTEGTPTATKGTVSNHSVSVTPSVTNTAGYISGGTKTGTAVTVSASELVSGTKSISANGTGIDVTNYQKVDVAVPAPTPTLQTKSKTYTPTTSQQTETITADAGYDGLDEVDITVNAMPSGTAGTPSATKGTVSNHSVTVTPSVTNTTGYITGGTKTGTAVTVSASDLVSGTYTVSASGTADITNYADLSVPSGSAGSPALSVGEVTNHAVTVRASTIRTAGWIPGGTVQGASRTISASDLVSGSQNITSNNTYDVTNLAQVVVNVSGGTPTYETVTKTYTPTESQQTETITASSGYDAIEEVDVTVGAISSTYVGSGITRRSSSDLTASGGTVTAPSGYYSASATKTISSGTATPASSISGTSATVSTGTNTITLSKTVSNTPQVSAGYISSGTAGNSSVSLTANVTTKAAATIYPSTSSQTIASGTYLTGTQTISAVSQTNLAAENIKSGTTISISNGNGNIWSVLGTYSGGGGTDRLVLLQTTSLGTLSTSSTSASDTGKSISCASSTNWDDYDLLIVDVSVDTKTNGRHTSTVSFVLLTGTSNVNTKNTYTVGSNKWNSKLGSTGTASTRQSTSAYGVYVNSASVSSSTLTMPLYYRYNSNSTGTLNGTYTARVYGVKLIDLIGG